VGFSGKRLESRIFDRMQLRHGQTLEGPAIVGEYSATTLVPPGWLCRVDAFLNLILSRGES
jgi:N-methylhydantoinase A